MVCRTTPGNSAFTTVARAQSGLHDVQVLSMFHQIRRDAPAEWSAPSDRERQRWLTQLRDDAAGLDLPPRSRASLDARLREAMSRDVDARTFYAWSGIGPQATRAAQTIDTHLSYLARRHGTTVEEVRAAYDQTMQMRRAPDGSEIAAPEHLPFATDGLPRDARTLTSLAMLYNATPQACREDWTSTYARAHQAPPVEQVNPANHCPECGQFADTSHTCPQSTSQAPDTGLTASGRRRPTPLRTYQGSGGVPVRVMNLSALRETLREQRRQSVPVHVHAVVEGHIVSGELAVWDSGRRATRHVSRYGAEAQLPRDNTDTLQCPCPQYQANYTCPHVDLVADDMRRLLNRDDMPAVVPASVLAAVNADLGAEHDSSLMAAQAAREAHDTGAATSTSYTASMEPFQAVYDTAKAHFASGEHRLPYMTENATGGLGSPDGGRSFGIEIEVDFPDDMTHEMRHRVAQAIYDAGLSQGPEVRPWHWQARAIGPRGRTYGGGYTTAPNAWSVERDSSVDGLNGERGIEIVSPILYDTPQTWANLKTVCDIVERHGGRVHQRTGLHINVGAADFDHDVANHNRLLGLANAYEDVLTRVAHNPQAGAQHRGREYCRPLSVPSEGYQSIRQAQANVDPRGHGQSHRAFINLDHVPAEGAPVQSSTRVEVRLWDGAVDPGRIQANVKMSLGLVNAAVRGVEVPATPEPSGTHRARNRAQTGRTRNLTGQEWETDTATFRQLVDTVFTRDEDKEQAVYAFAATKWQAAAS